MNKNTLLCLGFNLGLTIVLAGKVVAQPETGSPSRIADQLPGTNCFNSTASPSDERSVETVKLYYNREVTVLKTTLETLIDACNDKPLITTQGTDILLYGSSMQREGVKRIITLLDLPRERVNLAMWGIQISSKNPRKTS